MANNYFVFKQFTVRQEHAAFKITTDSVLLGAWADLEGCKTVLDIGTGTGILALMAAQRTEASIVALEPDPQSCMQARLNFTSSPWNERITLINESVQDYHPAGNFLFDSIISNPPFFSDSLPNTDGRKARTRHSLTLSHKDVIDATRSLMKTSGKLNLVLPADEAARFVNMAETSGIYCWRRLLVRPTPLLPPARVLLTLGREKMTIEESSITIETGGRHQYSDEYISLTKEFYLKF